MTSASLRGGTQIFLSFIGPCAIWLHYSFFLTLSSLHTLLSPMTSCSLKMLLLPAWGLLHMLFLLENARDWFSFPPISTQLFYTDQTFPSVFFLPCLPLFEDLPGLSMTPPRHFSTFWSFNFQFTLVHLLLVCISYYIFHQF